MPPSPLTLVVDPSSTMVPPLSVGRSRVTAMALHLHRAERTDLLADGLGTVLADPLSDPFAEELVLVPARGVERWLSQRLSHVLGRRPGSTDGVCAAVSFRSPASLIAEISEISGTTGTTEPDPWSPDAMTWPLLEVIDSALDQPWCRTLAKHLGHFDIGAEADLRRGRRYSVARRLAGMFASYARQRPRLLADWLDGNAGDLDADLAWQPELWRALVTVIAADPPHIRHEKTLTRLRERPADLPSRLSLFGHTRLACTDIELLDAVAAHHDLHLWLPHPSDELWRALAGTHGPVPRREDTSHRAVSQPLLATLGRDLRELQRSLSADPATDEALECPDRPDTLLGWLQSDLSANAVRPQGRKLSTDDRSIQVHSCHGPARQVDVLREVLLGLLADDPTLEPRDILVMCPDIETYAPLIVADFGLGDVVHGAHPAHRLRVRLADRSLLQTNPLLGVASQLLMLAGSRVTASEVLNLAQAAPVRARFGFDDDDLEGITRWVRQSNIRWGFDQEHRAPFGVDFVHNTWQFGTDRVLAGVAMSETSHAWIDSTLPLDDVGSNRVELAGQFAEYIDRLRRVVDSLTGAKPLREWLAALADGIGLVTRIDDSPASQDAWQSNQVQREFAGILRTAGPRAETLLRLSDVRALLQRHLAGRPTRANFRTGTLTVCTMVPMRSVPHRVVCLVGLDDGVFPRIGVVDGDDVLARRPMTGERDIRSEDRQLLLDAICAATDNLVITYTGANEYSGQRRPPAVPLAELLDAVDLTTTEKVRSRVVVEHPLQPFDIRNVERGRLVPGTPFSFDSTVLRAAQTAAGERAEQPKFISGPLPARDPDDVVLADLVAFFRDPVKGFFRALDYTLPWDVDSVEDAMPVDINALEEWTVGDRMLSDILGGMAPDDARHAEWRRGTVPPGQLGWRKVTEIRDQAALLASAALRRRGSDMAAYDVDIDLGPRRLTGTVSQVFGDRLVSVTYSKLDGKHLLESWIPLLALFAHYPDRDWSAVCIGRQKRGTTPREEGLGRPRESAVDALRELLSIYDAGRREPIPLPVKTSYAWAAARHCGDDPVREASFRWKSSDRYPAEDQAPAHVRAWGKNARLTDLMQPLRPGEEYPVSPKGEDNRLGAFAARLWMPMLRAARSPGS
jgi:exodeoxyribonuclease V gamma subunit